MSDAISLRRAIEPDLEDILAIEHQAPAAAHWSRAVYAAIVTADVKAQPERLLLVAEHRSQVVGFAVAQGISSPGHAIECELENIAVLNRASRAGIGSALLQSVCDWARAQGAIELRTEVRDSNLVAQQFYGRAGFAQTSTRPHYYHDPIEDARLLALHL